MVGLERVPARRTDVRWNVRRRTATLLARSSGSTPGLRAGHHGTTTTVSRTICAALASALAALALGGCYQVTAEDAVQQDIIGDTVRATATFALDGTAAGRLPGQFLAASLVPDGATAPPRLDARCPGAPSAVAMTRRPSLDESLQ